MDSRYSALIRLQIPHEITYTDTLLKWLMRIAESRPFLDEYLGTPQEVNLLRKAKIRAITYSNQIEGNHLGESEVTTVLQGKRVARFVPSETAIMRGRDRYYFAIRQSRSLGQINPILEYLAECFAISAEEVVEEGRKLLRESAGKTPEARHRKILTYAQKQEEFSMQDVVGWMPDIPRRTLERDIATLVKNCALKSKGELKARVYSLSKRKK